MSDNTHAAMCVYCGEAIIYDTREVTDMAEAHANIAAHDQKCPKNPLVARIAELEQDRDSLQRLANCRADQRDALAAHVEWLRERFAMCRHHACYSIGDSGPLAIQLASIRKVANEALRVEPENSLVRRDALKQAEGEHKCAYDLRDYLMSKYDPNSRVFETIEDYCSAKAIALGELHQQAEGHQ